MQTHKPFTNLHMSNEIKVKIVCNMTRFCMQYLHVFSPMLHDIARGASKYEP